MKNLLAEPNSRFQLAEETISKHEYKPTEIIQYEEQKLKNGEKYNLRELWDTIKDTDICKMGIPEQKEK